MKTEEGMKYYLNNPYLKAAGVQMQFEPWQIEELIKCSKSVVYFAENYCHIVSGDKGRHKIEMYPYQPKLLEMFEKERRVIALLPRQMGKTTVSGIFILHYVLFNADKTVGIVANKAPAAREVLDRVKGMYENLPFWMQQGIKTWNKGDIELGNNSKVLTSATSASAFRGKSIQLLYIDEAAFIPNNMAEEFFQSVYPTVAASKTSKIFFTSTPKGLNYFYKYWTDAKEGRSEFKSFEVAWNAVPGRDEKFKQNIIDTQGRAFWDQEFDCQFLGSQGSLISSGALRALAPVTPLHESNSLKVYEEPQEGRTYFMGVDVSRGTGGDYSVVQVIDITELPYKQVATFRNNHTSHIVFPRLIAEIGKKYNDAYVLVEINDIGEAVADSIYHDQEYENLLTVGSVKNKQVLGSYQGSKNGLRTTTTSKNIGCGNLKALIEGQKLLIQDMETISELSNFVSKGKSYEAEEGLHDDLVMGLVVMAWASSQDYFRELNNTDFRKKVLEDREEQIIEELSPLGFFDGFEDQEQTWETLNF